MIRGILYFTVIILSIYSLYASEDPLRDTLWIRQMPLGGQNFSKPLFHPNGKTVFATSDQYMFEYDVATGELLKTRETKSQLHINDYVLTSDTKHIIVGTLEDEATRRGYIEVWDIDTGFVKSLTLNKYDLVQRLAVSSDNKTLFVGTHSPSLYRINLATMLIEKEEDDYGFGDEIALSPDEKTLVVTTQYFQGGDMPWSVLLDSESFKVIGSIPDFISRPTFSSTGEYIVGGTYYQKKDYIALYNVRTGEYNRMGVNSTVLDAKFTKDNKYFIATT
ncbi:MAG TPA: WD40 repeat domain-containing protein, partial [Candidatus Kapabacteria bacterium]|nr:WD40 repeat domain-containing protein [Candidatus Kapabacteria bacterium]